MAFLSMGRETFVVPFQDLFVVNRRKLVEQLRGSTEGNDAVVFLEGGASTTRFDSDHEPLFRQESYFWYLSGIKEPDCAMALDVSSGETTIFVPRLPADYATIMGRIKSLEEWRFAHHADHAYYIDQEEDFLYKKLASTENGATKKLLLLKGVNSDSGKMYLPPTSFLKGRIAPFIDVDILFPILAECRVIKNQAELSLLQHVTEVTSFAHAYVMRNMKPGMMEYQGESLFRHYCYYNYGCRLVGYTPICGCGPNAAVLHYGHSGEPNTRQSEIGDIALFDMGAEYFNYGSDITCSFPISGKFNEQQRGIYQAVLNAQIAVYSKMKPGVSWADCHKAAEVEILMGLAELGIVVPNGKSFEELVEMRLGAVFMPCGMGHFIGIDTHDVGGYLDGHPERSQLLGLKSLRTARILEQNMTLTVEPGCYFIDHLLDGASEKGSPFHSYLNFDKLDEYRRFGGVRLEDVVVVTSTGITNYTLCPRTIRGG